MRTTFTLEDDVAAEVERVRREAGVGISEAVNRLIRAGMIRSPYARVRFTQRSAPLGLKVDVTHIDTVLDLLDEV